MSKPNDRYTQCRLTQGDSISQTTWIPAHLAKVGQTIELRNLDKEWTTWEVSETYSTIEISDVRAFEGRYRDQRSASDI